MLDPVAPLEGRRGATHQDVRVEGYEDAGSDGADGVGRSQASKIGKPDSQPYRADAAISAVARSVVTARDRKTRVVAVEIDDKVETLDSSRSHNRISPYASGERRVWWQRSTRPPGKPLRRIRP